MSARVLRPLALGALLTAAACGGQEAFEEPPGDPIDASFAWRAAKADGIYTECQLVEVLALVNEADTDVARLREGGIRSDAGGNIVEHRLGPDGVAGTADDDIFETFDELDDIPFVGPVTVEKLIAMIVDRCADDTLRPFIDNRTFEDDTGGGWTRDNVELEATMTVTGVTGQRLHSILFGMDDGRTGFERMRKVRALEAFTYNYPVDERPWSRRAHRLRQSFPHVALSIESGRFELDTEDNRRELSLGTDIMDDTYYDTDDFALLKSGIVLRGRVRWDDDETVRRLLIAAKFDAGVDEEGIKRAAKVDVRKDSPNPEHLASLDADVRRGKVKWSWGGDDEPVEPVRLVYDKLKSAGLTEDVHGHEDVLLLDPKVHIRSVRSRYHMNEATLDNIKSLHALGLTRIGEVVELAQKALDEGVVADGDVADVQDLISAGQAFLDGTAPAYEVGATPTSAGEVEALKAQAQEVSDAYHAFADQLDEVERAVSGNAGEWDDWAERFGAWILVGWSQLATKTTWDVYLQRYDALAALSEADLAAALAEFDAYGQQAQSDGLDDFEGWSGVDLETFAGVRKDLVREHLKIVRRQIEAAGTAALTLWFDQAREAFVPESNRSFGNFLIDTVDVAQMVTHEVWRSLPDSVRTDPSAVIPPEKVFHTTMVNEVQIELGSEKPYLERIEALRDGGGSTDELEGARWVFGEYRNALVFLADLKGEPFLDDLEDGGAFGAQWGPAERGKGATALHFLADLDE